MCFASVGSVLLVGTAVGFRALNSIGELHTIALSEIDGPHNHDFKVTLSWWPENWLKALYVFPMFGVSFLCHFNALPTHQELQRPTRQRMRRVLALCMGFTSILYLFVGLTGYLWAGKCTCGNILLNFRQDDTLIAMGRGALALVLMLNFPLLCQPCRNTLFRLVGPFMGKCSGAGPAALANELPSAQAESVSLQPAGRAPGTASQGDVVDICMVEEDCPQRVRLGADVADSSSAAVATSSQGSPSAQVHAYRREDTRGMLAPGTSLPAMDTFLPKDETVQQGGAESTPLQDIILTTLILVSSLLVSLFMGSIIVVWSIVGSTVAFLVAFIMPAAFWLQLVGPHSKAYKVIAAKVLLVSMSVIAVACTVLTCLNLSAPACPKFPEGA